MKSTQQILLERLEKFSPFSPAEEIVDLILPSSSLPKETIENIERSRSFLNGELFIDRLLSCFSIEAKDFYPFDKRKLQKLVHLILENKELDSLNKNCLFYYFQKECNRKQKDFHLPEHFKKLIDAYFYLDHHCLKEAFECLSDPHIEADWPEKIIGTFYFSKEYKLAILYAKKTQFEPMTDEQQLIYMNLLLRSDLNSALLFQRKNDLFVNLLEFMFDNDIWHMNHYIRLPFSQKESEILLQYCKKSDRLASKQFLIVFLMSRGRKMESFKVYQHYQSQFSQQQRNAPIDQRITFLMELVKNSFYQIEDLILKNEGKFETKTGKWTVPLHFTKPVTTTIPQAKISKPAVEKERLPKKRIDHSPTAPTYNLSPRIRTFSNTSIHSSPMNQMKKIKVASDVDSLVGSPNAFTKSFSPKRASPEKRVQYKELPIKVGSSASESESVPTEPNEESDNDIIVENMSIFKKAKSPSPLRADSNFTESEKYYSSDYQAEEEENNSNEGFILKSIKKSFSKNSESDNDSFEISEPFKEETEEKDKLIEEEKEKEIEIEEEGNDDLEEIKEKDEEIEIEDSYEKLSSRSSPRKNVRFSQSPLKSSSKATDSEREYSEINETEEDEEDVVDGDEDDDEYKQEVEVEEENEDEEEEKEEETDQDVHEQSEDEVNQTINKKSVHFTASTVKSTKGFSEVEEESFDFNELEEVEMAKSFSLSRAKMASYSQSPLKSFSKATDSEKEYSDFIVEPDKSEDEPEAASMFSPSRTRTVHFSQSPLKKVLNFSHLKEKQEQETISEFADSPNIVQFSQSPLMSSLSKPKEEELKEMNLSPEKRVRTQSHQSLELSPQKSLQKRLKQQTDDESDDALLPSQKMFSTRMEMASRKKKDAAVDISQVSIEEMSEAMKMTPRIKLRKNKSEEQAPGSARVTRHLAKVLHISPSQDVPIAVAQQVALEESKAISASSSANTSPEKKEVSPLKKSKSLETEQRVQTPLTRSKSTSYHKKMNTRSMSKKY